MYRVFLLFEARTRINNMKTSHSTSEFRVFRSDVTKTGKGERGTGNGERGTGNGERGTGVWERVYSGSSPENLKWQRKRRLQTLLLSQGRRLQCFDKKYCLCEATKPSIPRRVFEVNVSAMVVSRYPAAGKCV